MNTELIKTRICAEFFTGELYYKFYDDGENMVYITSVDNQSWSPPTSVNVAGGYSK